MKKVLMEHRAHVLLAAASLVTSSFAFRSSPEVMSFSNHPERIELMERVPHELDVFDEDSSCGVPVSGVAGFGEQGSASKFAFREYTGPKIRIAVSGEVRGSTSDVHSEVRETTEPSKSCGRLPVELIESSLAAAMLETHRFDVVGQEADGVVVPEGERPLAVYVISGTVIDCALYPSQAPESSASPASGEAASEISMSFRVVSADSGQVLFAAVERSRIPYRASERPAEDSEDFVGSERRSVLRSAIRTSIDKGSRRLVDWFEHRPWTGRVVSVQDRRIYVDAGRCQSLVPGMVLSAVADGRELIDPESGRVLGSVSEEIGRLEIVEVRDQHSIATILEGCDGIRPGDRVEWQSSSSEEAAH